MAVGVRGAEERGKEKRCHHTEATRFPSDTPHPQSTRVAPSPARGGLGQEHCREGAYRPESRGCQVWRALPAAHVILPATCGVRQLSALSTRPPGPSPSHRSTHLPVTFRERGWGPDWLRAQGQEGRRVAGMATAAPVKTDPRKVGTAERASTPPQPQSTTGGLSPASVVTLLPLTCPAVPWPPVSSSTTKEGKTPMRPLKSPVQKPSSTSPGARGSTRMMAPSGKLSSSGLCPS